MALPVSAVFLSLLVLDGQSVQAQDQGPVQSSEQPADLSRAPQTGKQFLFERAPWRAVLNWLADWADLELHVDTLPTGSFTYSTTRTYTAEEAINRINVFLIPQRYSLVRSGNLLSVISLDDQRSIRQLDALAVTVRLEELTELGRQELVKCLFPLGETPAERALQELGGLMLIREPVVLQNTNQLLVTDTVAKLRMVREILATLANPDPLVAAVKRFPLGSLDAERVLSQVRPHVGLDPLAMIGADIRLSIDLDGNQLLASGSAENLDAVAAVFRTLESAAPTPDPHGLREFRAHDLGEADMTTVVSVLNTLLVDEDVRMNADPKSNLIAIQGTSLVHDIVARTIEELTGSNAVEFRAIPVRGIDTRYAALILSEMFSEPAAATGQGGLSTSNSESPKIDADLLNNRLFVRARPAQIAAIQRALNELSEPELPRSANLRLLPYSGERGRRLLESAREFWPHNDELLILPLPEKAASRPLELEVNPERPPRNLDSAEETLETQAQSTAAGLRAKQIADAADRATKNRITSASPQWLASTSPVAVQNHRPLVDAPPTAGDVSRAAGERPPQIRVQWTPHGLLVQSDDPDALERFEKHLRLIAGPARADNQRLAVFHLKHAEVDDANRLLQRVLDAEHYATSLPASVRGLSVGGGMLENTLDSLGIATSSLGRPWSAGTATMIADKRLNRLFVYGTADDLAEIEVHLEVIDRESSIAHIKTHGVPHVIPLEHARAADVADILRDAYAGRIAASAKEIQAAAQQNDKENQQPGRQNPGSGGDQPSQPRQHASTVVLGRDQPLVKLAVDSPSNTLIVTAPEQLAKEIEQLARVIDARGAQSVRIIPVRGSSSSKIHRTLKNLFGERVRSTLGQTASSRPQTP